MQSYDDGTLKAFSLTDDYSQFAKNATVMNAQLFLNDQPASGFTMQDDHQGHLTFTATDPKSVQSETYTINITFQLNEYAQASDLINTGSMKSPATSLRQTMGRLWRRIQR